MTLCFTNSAPTPKIYIVTPTSVTLSSPSGSSVPGLGAFFKNASVRVSNVGGVSQVIATFTLTKALTSPLAATLTYLTQDLGAIYPTPPLTLRKPQLVYTAPP